jgi:NADH dehydrogenase FAD-containing subunit
MRAILAGAGHSHLHLIRNAAAFRAAGVTPVLVSPQQFHYSGLASAVLSGALPPESAEIDIAALARANGIEHHPDKISDVDQTTRSVTLDTGEMLAFDVLSLNTGSGPNAPSALLDQPNVWPAKPLASLLGARQLVEAHRGKCPPIVVAGCGPTAFELAASLAGLCERLSLTPDITLAGPDPHASWAPGSAGQRLTASLKRRGVKILKAVITAYDGAVCDLDTGQRLTCEALVLATGLKGSSPISPAGLPRDNKDRLIVTGALHATANPHVFATGDCASIERQDRPFAGVFGVRAAPILLHNLIATAHGQPLRDYDPQTRWLSIIDLGDGTALAMRGAYWWMGRLALLLKRRLDLGFIAANRA